MEVLDHVTRRDRIERFIRETTDRISPTTTSRPLALAAWTARGSIRLRSRASPDYSEFDSIPVAAADIEDRRAGATYR